MSEDPGVDAVEEPVRTAGPVKAGPEGIGKESNEPR